MNELATYTEDAMSSSMMLTDDATMNRIMKFAEIMATGKATIPAELRNVGDCLAITMQAMNWKMNPFSVAQKTFFIGGKIGYEAQLVAAAINNSGAVVGGFHFEWYGPWEKVIGKFDIRKGDKGEYRVPGWSLKDEEGIGIKVLATLKGESEPRVLDLLLAQARTRNSTLWADDPRQQLAYLGQKRWARLYAPGVILGVYTADELQQIPMEKEINPMPTKTAERAAELPNYPANQFSANLPKWRAAIVKGKTPESIITMISSKYVLSDAQKAEILTPIEEPSNDLFEQIKAKLEKADSVDVLDVAADLIGEVDDEARRAELSALYGKRADELMNG